MNPYPPIYPIDEKIYNIRLKDGTTVLDVEYWAFGGGFIPKQKELKRLDGFGSKYVHYLLEEITGFELVS